MTLDVKALLEELRHTCTRNGAEPDAPCLVSNVEMRAVLDLLDRAEAVCAAAGVFMDTRCLRLEGGAFQKAINTADDAESKLYASVDRWREEVQP